MTTPVALYFDDISLDSIAKQTGRIVVFLEPHGRLDRSSRRINRLTKGALGRFILSDAFEEMKEGMGLDLAYPSGMLATAIQVIRLSRNPTIENARKAGATIAKGLTKESTLVCANTIGKAAEISFGLALRSYDFTPHKTSGVKERGEVRFQVGKPEDIAAKAAPFAALAEGVFFTRDLVNEPSNVLTTDDFAARLAAMQDLGLEVEILEEAELEKLGMGAFLAVGQGSESASKVVVMQWNGGGKEAPLALVGKGVVFDTGGISIKPAAGMEDMTMDMGGAGVVAGVMRSLALRNAKANVVGLVGIVENMPDGKAMRPGDVVTSMKGDTIEVLNTDAEGRLVLCDVMWYAQERFKPSGMIDLATLTGAIIVGLGHDNAGVFSNNDKFCDRFLKAARTENEGAWRMPLGASYDELLKSPIADMKNIGGRAAGSITAAQFLQRFVQKKTPWIHLDIAGVAHIKTGTDLAPGGATGWGVVAIDRLIRDRFED
ncbi:leucyl aminopeptidase [Falsihalocynthiibacter arcticus]|uniref:Probable cytosol aminopeptidase n=1 Tax=Falsihalocynthiibacter arcticus TaxID=1579316 RepID=A0A126V4P4_9RHOB|nr:leucyl aminopeptidase [Falsihalocynthiibacter arcticus]AML53127.1 aminopeptidase [Falsihalocynthiibacter arcticus]